MVQHDMTYHIHRPMHLVVHRKLRTGSVFLLPCRRVMARLLDLRRRMLAVSAVKTG